MSEDKIKEEVRQSIREKEKIGEKYEDEFIKLLEAKYSNLNFDDEQVTLSRMRIKGFKAIEHLDIPFSDRATIVHGKNSKGKSSFIEGTRFNLLGRKDENALVTEPIHRNYDKIQTNGFWSKNGGIFKVYREMERKQSFVGQKYPNIVDDPDETEHSTFERQSQSEVNDLIGFTPLHEQGFDRFDIFSLFSIITGDLRSFYSCDDAADLIELLFGITLTNVERAVENEIENCELEDEEIEAKNKRLERLQRAERLSNEIIKHREEQEDVEEELSRKIDKRDELTHLLDNKDDINEDLSKKIDIKDDISNLQSRKDEKQEKFGSVKQEISKLESDAVTEEIAPALQEMKQLVSLPNRCPVCTSDVSPSDQKKFHEEGDCPLCGEDVTEDRYDTVSEIDEEGEVLEHEKRQEELEELESKKRTLKGEIEYLETQIEEKKQRLQTLERKEEESEFSEYKQRKAELEEEIAGLKDRSRSLELRVDTKREKLHEVAREVWKWTQLNEERKRKEQREKALNEFKSIIVEERAAARKDLQARIRRRMEELLTHFSHGTFENATGVTFDDDDSYKYTIHTEDRSQWKPGLLDSSNAELTLHMLLFHTAILSELEREAEAVPLKVLFIDSPYGNGQDGDNTDDITDFLLKLPDILDNYQLVVAMADSDIGKEEKLEESYGISPLQDYLVDPDIE